LLCKACYEAIELALGALAEQQGSTRQTLRSTVAPKDGSSGGSLIKVFIGVLVVIIGGIGWLAVSLAPELWQLAVGVPLVLLATWLFRVLQRDDA
jgi:hypothetical protein